MTTSHTFARVDLGQLGTNLGRIRQRVGRPVLLPVKANAYGHGLLPVARAVQEHGWADWLAVATVAEGTELRRAGITLPILKFYGTSTADTPGAVDCGLTLTIADLAGAEAAQQAAADRGKVVTVHLKIDSGMHRVGVLPAAAADLASVIERQPNLDLEGIYTHLAVSDMPDQADFTAGQLAGFAAAVDAVETRLGRRLKWRHAANSGAVLTQPDSWYDLVRPGIMSYGYYPDAATPRTVEVAPVLSWHSQLAFVKAIQAGDSVGYGRTWWASQDSFIGTIPVGYGDGYARRLGNLGQVLIAGRRYPVVGRVCMDQIMVDLGPDSRLTVGTPVTLIGTDGNESIGADEIGDQLGTISYEVLCAIAARVERVY